MNSAKIITVIIVVAICAACLTTVGGCGPGQKAELLPGQARLTVDFQQGRSLQYKFISKRDITLNWGRMGRGKQEQNKIDKFTESFDLVVSYAPVKVDPYGLATIGARCEKATVSRSGDRPQAFAHSDAVESVAGKTWTFTVDATGKMEDRSKLYDVTRQAGQKAFREDRSQGLIKEPDMIYDFIASQWFLWDSISSIKKPLAGVRMGDRWQSKLFVPAPMILFAARDVNYELEEIRKDPNGRIAVIGSSYALSYPCPSEWPVPYTDIFQMSGTFGFLRGYKVLDLQGSGQDFFNIDKGRIERSNQQWEIHVLASLPLEMGPKPQITIEQTLTMELIEPLK